MNSKAQKKDSDLPNLGLLILSFFAFLMSCEAYEAPAPVMNADLEKIASIPPDLETSNMDADIHADAADDPAIFIHPTNPDSSFIIGTHKKKGLRVYRLNGQLVNAIDCGRVNNVDLRQNVKIGKWEGTLVGSSNRSGNLITLHQLTRNGELIHIGSVPTNLSEVYGFCMASLNNKTYAIINDKDGRIQEYELYATENDSLPIHAKLKRSFKVASQPEGMVVDESFQTLFVGEEQLGIWKFNLNSEEPKGELLLNSLSENNPFIQYDIEGITIYQKSDSSGYLIASSQGSYSYAIFDRKAPHSFITAFKVGGSTTIDEVEETDGLDVTALPSGNEYPLGFAVFQDGFNFNGGTKEPQNFKLVDWQKIQQLINNSIEK